MQQVIHKAVDKCRDLIPVVREAFSLMLPEEPFEYDARYGTGSTDMGDLSSVMPVVHPYVGGATGLSHGNNYEIADPEMACVNSAKVQVAMLYLLLGNNAQKAKEILKNYEPMFATREAYFTYLDSLSCSGDRSVYKEDGNAEIKLV